MITPSDIPDDLAEYVCTFADLSPKQGKGMVAAILNAAIEAGLVVPASEAKVLRRAIDNAARANLFESYVDAFIDEARKELESEEAK